MGDEMGNTIENRRCRDCNDIFTVDTADGIESLICDGCRGLPENILSGVGPIEYPKPTPGIFITHKFISITTEDGETHEYKINDVCEAVIALMEYYSQPQGLITFPPDRN